MTPIEISELLDGAETDLKGVSLSMLAPDPLLLRHSQGVLERLVEDLNRVKNEASSTGHLWPVETRRRLQSFAGRLTRLQAFGEAAVSAVILRSQLTGMETAGYSIPGRETPCPDVTTISLDC